jgi:photosystem II stability/assembly factor-like uncharacterized protein
MKKIAFYFIVFCVLVTYFQSEKTDTKLKSAPSDYFFMQRAFPNTESFGETYLKEIDKILENRKSNSQSLAKAEYHDNETWGVQTNGFNKTKASFDEELWEWKNRGPYNIGGRITDVEMHSSNTNTLFIGAASGGVFKSTDLGENWTPIFDDQATLSIGDIAIAPSNSNVIYVGTGESNAGGGSQTYDGNGIYKSTDGGSSFEHLGLEESRAVGHMQVHPENEDILYVAAMGDLFANNSERGIYRTQDGGQNWEQVLYINDSTGAIDVCMNPQNPEILYAATWERVRRPDYRSYGGDGSDIYKSTDGGDTWTLLSNGLPQGENIGRIGLTICDSQPNILYALIMDKTGYLDGVYRTDDHGENWEELPSGNLSSNFSSYGWWFGRIKTDPQNPDRVYALGLDIYRSLNGGQSWSYASSGIHVDQQSLYIHPENPSLTIAGNDGGLYISDDAGQSYTHMENLPISQFYTCEFDESFPERLYGGTQDNASMRTFGLENGWEAIYYGDGFGVLVDPSDNNYVYTESQYGNFVRSTSGGNYFMNATSGINTNDNFNWNTPFCFDPSNPDILYIGSERVYKSTNKASLWTPISEDLTNGPATGNLVYHTISTIDVSPLNSDVIYVGTDDGNVWVSQDGGSEWTLISEELPERWVTRVTPHTTEAGGIYVCFSGYRHNEYLAHIYYSDDYGQNWEAITEGLPEIPVNDLIIDPENSTVLYCATDAGVYRKIGDEPWHELATGMPVLVINDLDIHNPSRQLLAASFGRSMWSLDLEDEFINIENKVCNETPVLYPNPAEDYLYLKNTEEYTHYRITNTQGKVVKEGKLESSICVTGLAQGMYVVELSIGNRKWGGAFAKL